MKVLVKLKEDIQIGETLVMPEGTVTEAAESTQMIGCMKCPVFILNSVPKTIVMPWKVEFLGKI